MIAPEIPFNEKERLRNLKEYHILDTMPEEDFDDITRIASEICQTPIALVSLIDEERQWFKSHQGLHVSETPKEYAFCAHAINHINEVFTVPDSRLDERFFDNPLVTGDPLVIFYTGVPLKSTEGFALGTLCVIDHEPKVLSDNQIKSLKSLSRQVVKLFELRKHKELLEKIKKDLESNNKELERFAYVAAHDLKSPLHAISSLTQIFIERYSSKLDVEMKEFINHINGASKKLTQLISGILEHSKSEKFLTENKVEINVDLFFEGIHKLLDPTHIYHINYKKISETIFVNKIALEQIFINLISNSIKYNDKESIVIEMGFTQNDEFYNFYVKDNGPGISKKSQDRIFNLFDTEGSKDRFGNKGNGIGLATVKKLIERQGGQISIKSELREGATFVFSIAK